MRERPDGALVFALFASDFPKTASPLLALEDVPGDDPKQFGKLGAIYIGSASGLKLYSPAEAGADADTQASFARTLALLRTDALAAFDYRSAARTTTTSRVAADRVAAMKRGLARLLGAQQDSAQAITELADRITAKSTEPAASLAEIEGSQRTLLTASARAKSPATR